MNITWFKNEFYTCNDFQKFRKKLVGVSKRKKEKEHKKTKLWKDNY